MAKRSPLSPLELWVIHTAQPWARPRYTDDSKDIDIEKTAGLGPSCGVGHGVINTLSKVNNYNITDLITVNKPADTKIILLQMPGVRKGDGSKKKPHKCICGVQYWVADPHIKDADSIQKVWVQIQSVLFREGHCHSVV